MNNTLKDLLEEKRSVILTKWFDSILDTYPADDSGFLKKQKDRFLNPIGHTFTNGIDGVLGGLISGQDVEESASFLNDIIKVRAVQSFSPSKAMGFIFALKKVVREELKKEIRQNQINEELLGFESKIDDLALFAFDIYAKCRDQLSEQKTEELKRMTFSLLKKANLVSEIPAQEFERKDLDFNI
ncbi:MAG: RsbRD N-terminal domain-containing protein [Bacillota bacterium]|nr:RsbRD N-terminal domain-containing protein [Bacillota bacterium]MDP4158523.1 RsbRD N-terminal domain-containing protein [Bacillota bacterium]